MLNKRHQDALDEALNKIRLSEISNDIVSIYLYGSCARGEQKYSSDIDLFVVLSQDFQCEGEEKKKMRKLQAEIKDVDLDSPEIDMHITIGNNWEKNDGQYYRNIRKEGISVWN